MKERRSEPQSTYATAAARLVLTTERDLPYCPPPMIHVSEQLKACLASGGRGDDAFDAIMKLDGEVFRTQKNRRTIRAVIAGHGYFIKTHGPTTWSEILKNALRGRWPVLTAETEWRAIQRLEQLGIPTTPAVAHGVRGRFPDQLESFIMTEELVGMIHLHELPAHLSRLRLRTRTKLIRLLITQTANIARTLHTNGLNHRDFYLCHFMLRDREWSKWTPNDELALHLIDLHRMQRRHKTPQRWAIKDISGLLFSAFDAGLTSRDYLRFLSVYWGVPWRERWASTRGWRQIVVRRAISLYRSEHGKSPRLPAGLASFS